MTTIICSKCPPSVDTHAGWKHWIWHNFLKIAGNWIKMCSLVLTGRYNRQAKYGLNSLKIPNRLEKNARKHQGGGLTHTVHAEHQKTAHPYIFQLVRPFHHRMTPWKLRDDISNGSGVFMLTDRHTNRRYWKQYHTDNTTALKEKRWSLPWTYWRTFHWNDYIERSCWQRWDNSWHSRPISDIRSAPAEHTGRQQREMSSRYSIRRFHEAGWT